MTRTLRTAQLGRTGLQITRVGFGAWAIGGGGWEFGWGPQDDDQSIAAVHRALELGVNWIDTAAAYGFGRLGGGGRAGPGGDRTLRYPAVDAAIVGFRRPDQVDPLLPAADLDLTAEDLAEIEGGNR